MFLYILLIDLLWRFLKNAQYYLFDSTKSEDDGPFIFLDNSDTEKDGDGECEDDQDY